MTSRPLIAPADPGIPPCPAETPPPLQSPETPQRAVPEYAPPPPDRDIPDSAPPETSPGEAAD